MRRTTGLIGSLALIAMWGPSFGQNISGSAERGAEIAERWCSACHLVSERQEQATPDAPTFMSIAERSPEAIDALAGFLMDPHPPMPDLSLTRVEIRDLLAYIESLQE
jgi:cytochrome c